MGDKVEEKPKCCQEEVPPIEKHGTTLIYHSSINIVPVAVLAGDDKVKE